MSNKPSSLRSKKFFAFLISDLGWKALTFYVIYQYRTEINHFSIMLLLTMIVTSGFLQIGYILGQAALDKYVYLADRAIDRDDEQTPDKSKGEKDVS